MEIQRRYKEDNKEIQRRGTVQGGERVERRRGRRALIDVRLFVMTGTRRELEQSKLGWF